MAWLLTFGSLRPHHRGKRIKTILPGSTASAATTSAAAAAPLVDALKQCCTHQQNVAAFHFPGHGRGASAPQTITTLLGNQAFQADLPELPGLDNLHSPEGVISQAQLMASRLFNSDSTWFLVNGSTCGIQAAIMSTCKPGDYLILPRNCHLSAVSAMVLSGAIPRFLSPVYDPAWEVSHGVSLKEVEAAIEELERRRVRVGAVLVVSPTYFGVCSPVRGIAEVCHRIGIPLIVDEAHGAHFGFHTGFPATALEQGADLVVQSTHKVLSSLTQSAMLHLAGTRVDRERVSRCLRSLQSSSPSYLLMASLDASREQLSMSGSVMFDNALQLAAEARAALGEIPGISVMDQSNIVSFAGHPKDSCFTDRLRITVGLWELGVTGAEADEFLCEQHKVVAELPSLNSITFALGCGNSRDDVGQLVTAFQELSRKNRSSSTKNHNIRHAACCSCQTWGPMRMSPRYAFYADACALEAEKAVGHTSAEMICPYPPGIPVLFPGETITCEALVYLKQVHSKGFTITGASDPTLSTLLVCA